MLRLGARGVASSAAPHETYELAPHAPLDEREEDEVLEEELFGDVEQQFNKKDFGQSHGTKRDTV